MTRGSTREYAKAVRGRYRRARRKEKAQFLDEFMRVTGYHRKAAIRLLGRDSPPAGAGPGVTSCGPRGRPRRYGPEVASALKALWEAADRICSRRLQPFIPELLEILERQGELILEPGVAQRVRQVSAATIDRLLRPYRSGRRRRGLTTTRPGALLKRAVPIRTFADWEEDRPGFVEVDLVAHCGESTEGFYLTTLGAVAVATGWSEWVGVWGKGQERVGAAVHRLRQRLPFPLLGLDSDNGSEFINQVLYSYCQRGGITFTRSRPYKKNDSAHVEQKNWWLVRRLIGYDRYSSQEALEALERVYGLVRLYANFFQPALKLVGKERQGAKVRKRYDVARTPYQRVLAYGIADPGKAAHLAELYRSLNPVRLRAQVEAALEELWPLAARPHPPAKAAGLGQSVAREPEERVAALPPGMDHIMIR